MSRLRWNFSGLKYVEPGFDERGTDTAATQQAMVEEVCAVAAGGVAAQGIDFLRVAPGVVVGIPDEGGGVLDGFVVAGVKPVTVLTQRFAVVGQVDEQGGAPFESADDFVEKLVGGEYRIVVSIDDFFRAIALHFAVARDGLKACQPLRAVVDVVPVAPDGMQDQQLACRGLMSRREEAVEVGQDVGVEPFVVDVDRLFGVDKNGTVALVDKVDVCVGRVLVGHPSSTEAVALEGGDERCLAECAFFVGAVGTCQQVGQTAVSIGVFAVYVGQYDEVAPPGKARRRGAVVASDGEVVGPERFADDEDQGQRVGARRGRALGVGVGALRRSGA